MDLRNGLRELTAFAEHQRSDWRFGPSKTPKETFSDTLFSELGCLNGHFTRPTMSQFLLMSHREVWTAARNHHLIRKILVQFEPLCQLADNTSRDARNACFNGPRPPHDVKLWPRICIWGVTVGAAQRPFV